MLSKLCILCNVQVTINVKLTSFLASGVRQTGAAAIDPSKPEATITIEGSNDPHGIFSFSPGALDPDRPPRIHEGDDQFQLTVERKFGAIGQYIITEQLIYYSLYSQ